MPQNAEDRGHHQLTMKNQQKAEERLDNTRCDTIKFHCDKWLMEEIQNYDEGQIIVAVDTAPRVVSTMKGNKAPRIQTMQQLRMKLAERIRS